MTEISMKQNSVKGHRPNNIALTFKHNLIVTIGIIVFDETTKQVTINVV